MQDEKCVHLLHINLSDTTKQNERCLQWHFFYCGYFSSVNSLFTLRRGGIIVIAQVARLRKI